MAKKLLFVLCALTLLLGVGQAVAFTCLDPAASAVQTVEKPELKTLIGTGIWWGKSETLERNVSRTGLEAADGTEKI